MTVVFPLSNILPRSDPYADSVTFGCGSFDRDEDDENLVRKINWTCETISQHCWMLDWLQASVAVSEPNNNKKNIVWAVTSVPCSGLTMLWCSDHSEHGIQKLFSYLNTVINSYNALQSVGVSQQRTNNLNVCWYQQRFIQGSCCIDRNCERLLLDTCESARTPPSFNLIHCSWELL